MNAYETQNYAYSLPNELIATEPAKPKDSSRLLVFNRQTDTLTHTHFREIEQFLPADTTLFFNNTKVIKARIFGHKESGGKVELLFNKPYPNNEFLVYIRGKVKVGTMLLFQEGLQAEVLVLNEDGSRLVRFFFAKKQLNFEALEAILSKIGHIPLPPYMNREDTAQDEQNYQPVFAEHAGAVAAPTASLHFTKELFERVTTKFKHGFITLHVGAGTFKPVEANDIREHVMHAEFYNIDEKSQELIASETNILAVGTTVTRTLEYYARHGNARGEADLFLHPNNKPLRVNHLLTNFHLPKSTLIMLVASFLGIEKTLELYNIAVQERYRFYSYGDAMLII